MAQSPPKFFRYRKHLKLFQPTILNLAGQKNPAEYLSKFEKIKLMDATKVDELFKDYDKHLRSEEFFIRWLEVRKDQQPGFTWRILNFVVADFFCQMKNKNIRTLNGEILEG